MSEIRWEKPPRGNPYESKWRDVARRLRSRPGDWAHVDTKSTAILSSRCAANIRCGVLADMPRGHFEATTCKAEGGYHVYARYVGPS